MIKINIQDKLYEVKEGISLLEIAEMQTSKYQIVGAIVNNKLQELTYTLHKDCTIEFIDGTSVDGINFLNRGLCFLFLKSVNDLYPSAAITIVHSLHRGLLCEFTGIQVTNKVVHEIRERMKQLVDMKIPFVKTAYFKKEALELLKRMDIDKYDLVLNCDKEVFHFYDCDGYKNCFYGHIVPDTSYLTCFKLSKLKKKNAILLFGADRSNPTVVSKYEETPKLTSIFEERRDWGEIMGVNKANDLNIMVKDGTYPELIRLMEALHENKIAEIANQIAYEEKLKRIILIAGPSSSGKTTFSKRLALQLKVNKLNPVSISTDDYFINRVDTPLDEFGNRDYESFECLDHDLFNKHLNALLRGEEVELPTYNFIKGEREYTGNKLKLKYNQPVIIEGIHSLNPRLTDQISDEDKFKIYVSPLTQLSLDNHNPLSVTDVRLLRRIVRDNLFRNHSASQTIGMWPLVRNGERKNIYPFQENADVMFNTDLTYDLSILKTYALPLLSAITNDDPSYKEARRLIHVLSFIKGIDDTSAIPNTSIMAEFLGFSQLV